MHSRNLFWSKKSPTKKPSIEFVSMIKTHHKNVDYTKNPSLNCCAKKTISIWQASGCDDRYEGYKTSWYDEEGLNASLAIKEGHAYGNQILGIAFTPYSSFRKVIERLALIGQFVKYRCNFHNGKDIKSVVRASCITIHFLTHVWTLFCASVLLWQMGLKLRKVVKFWKWIIWDNDGIYSPIDYKLLFFGTWD